MNSLSCSRISEPYPRWHKKDHPYLSRKRLRLESLLGGICSFCGKGRSEGVNLQFHHHLGRDWRDKEGNPLYPKDLSWSQRLTRYDREIQNGELLYLACDHTGNNCHVKEHGRAPGNHVMKLYEYSNDENQPF